METKTNVVEFFSTDGTPVDSGGCHGNISECHWLCPALTGLVVGRDDAAIDRIANMLGNALPVIERDDAGSWRCTGRVQDFCGLSGGGHEMNTCEFEDTSADEPSAWNNDRSGGVPTFATWEKPADDES